MAVVVDYEREIALGERGKEKRAYASLYVGKGGKKKWVLTYWGLIGWVWEGWVGGDFEQPLPHHPIDRTNQPTNQPNQSNDLHNHFPTTLSRSVGEGLVGEGLASVLRHRQDEERAENYDDLLVAETTAKVYTVAERERDRLVGVVVEIECVCFCLG